MLEFTLVGVPLLFAVISIVEMSRGMWIYHSQAYAINEGVRYAVVHGADCSAGTNSCGITVGQIANYIATVGTGLNTPDWNVTLYSASLAAVPCNPLSSCFNSTTVWPQSPDNAAGASIAIASSYHFKTSLAMYWPGSLPVNFGTFNLPAYSQQAIQY